MKWFAAPVALLALGAAVAATAVAAAPQHASITIRHQTVGCHAWALGSGPYKAHVDAKLAAGSSISFKDIDVMPHQLIEKSGPAVVYTGSRSMRHMGATVKVTFRHVGTYRFTTRVGEDYTNGIKTTGEDNVLTLTVTVR